MQSNPPEQDAPLAVVTSGGNGLLHERNGYEKLDHLRLIICKAESVTISATAPEYHPVCTTPVN